MDISLQRLQLTLPHNVGADLNPLSKLTEPEAETSSSQVIRRMNECVFSPGTLAALQQVRPCR